MFLPIVCCRALFLIGLDRSDQGHSALACDRWALSIRGGTIGRAATDWREMRFELWDLLD
jgi:hypothetical protein